MKKVGTITESRMIKPAEPKSYPLVSDALFGGRVMVKENKTKGYPKKGIKGGTKAAAKEASKKAKAKKVGNAKLLKDDDVLPVKQNLNNKVGSMGGYKSQRGNTENPDNEQVYNSMTDAKDSKWIQGAEEDIERRGTEGKCTPITKKGCTGKAKALAKTFKKMAKKKKLKKESVGPDSQKLADLTMDKKKQADLEAKRKAWRDALRSTGDDGKGLEKEAFEPLAKPRGTAKAVRRDTASAEARPNKPLNPTQAKNVAGNKKAEMGARMRGAEQMK